MLMVQDQAETWAANANQFVADEEEDIVSCRFGGLTVSRLGDLQQHGKLGQFLQNFSVTRPCHSFCAANAGKSV